MPSKTIACLSNPSSSRSSVGFHLSLVFAPVSEEYICLFLWKRGILKLAKTLLLHASLYSVAWSSRANISPENLSTQTLPKQSSKGCARRNEGIAEASARLNNLHFTDNLDRNNYPP